MSVRAVIFDVGGVLITSPFDAFARYEAANGLPPGLLRRLNATNPDTNAWARLERNEVDLAAFAAQYEAEAADAGYTVDGRAVLACLAGELRPEMVEALRRCHERLKTAMLTNNFVGPGAAPREPGGWETRLLDHVDVVVESSRVGLRKPDPAIYRLVCDELGVTPPEAVFLDDLGVNLKPARALGMTTIKVTDPGNAIAELERAVGFPLRDVP
jgi:putative hydrolase of the HAD superfamily